jgi:hypothetical protein
MSAAGLCMPPVYGDRHDARMDIVAILLGVVMFAILFALVAGIDRI